MLYLAVTFFVISCLASIVALAALMRSAQITRQLEEQGLLSLEQLTHPFHPIHAHRMHRRMIQARQ